MTRITRRGATVEMAISSALAALGVTRNDVEVEVIDEGKKGFLGFGAREAEVAVVVKKVEEPSVEKAIETEIVEEKLEVEAQQSLRMKEEVPEFQEVGVSEQVEESPKEVLSDEVAISETAQYLKQVAGGMGIDDLEVNHQIEGKYLLFQLNSEKAAYLIGKRGQTLNALQQLAQLVTNKYASQFKVVRIDVGDYRERREKALEQLAERMADKAVRSGRKVQLEPMPSHERKVIHNALSNRLDIETYSEGTDPNRYLVIEAVK